VSSPQSDGHHSPIASSALTPERMPNHHVARLIPTAVTRILQSVLFGVSPFDPIAFIGAPLFLLGVAAAASVIPTREALKLDPMTTLRTTDAIA
jgi:hypothetical protein